MGVEREGSDDGKEGEVEKGNRARVEGEIYTVAGKASMG